MRIVTFGCRGILVSAYVIVNASLRVTTVVPAETGLPAPASLRVRPSKNASLAVSTVKCGGALNRSCEKSSVLARTVNAMVSKTSVLYCSRLLVASMYGSIRILWQNVPSLYRNDGGCRQT